MIFCSLQNGARHMFAYECESTGLGCNAKCKENLGVSRITPNLSSCCQHRRTSKHNKAPSHKTMLQFDVLCVAFLVPGTS